MVLALARGPLLRQMVLELGPYQRFRRTITCPGLYRPSR
jgi:hypothetical protein